MVPSQPEPSPKAAYDREVLETENLKLAEDKLRKELHDLSRPYLFRNPQLLTALITSIGAVIGVSLLIEENYFKIREERNRLQEVETARANKEAREAIDAANMARVEAARTVAEADTAKKRARRTVIESNRQLEVAEGRLATVRESLKSAEVELQSQELVAAAERLVAQRQAVAAQQAAIAAWKLSQTNAARNAIVHAFSLPTITLKGAGNRVVSASFSPDGKNVVTGSQDCCARLWDATTGKQLAELMAFGAVNDTSFSPDGQRVLVVGDYGAWVFSATGTRQGVVLNGHEGRVSSGCFSVDGQRVVTSGQDGTARVWDANTGKQLSLMQVEMGRSRNVYTASFSKNGRHILTTSEHDFGDAAGGGPLFGVGPAGLWDANTGKRLATIGSKVNSAVFSSDGRHIGTNDAGATVRVSDAENGKEIETMNVTNQAVVTFSSDGRRFMASFDGIVRVWDVDTGKQRVTISETQALSLFSAAFSRDGRRILTLCGKRSDQSNGSGVNPTSACLWDADTGEQLATLEGHIGEVNIARFSPDGQRVVTASNDHTAAIYSLVTPSDVGRLFAVRR